MSTQFSLEAVRAATPGIENVIHVNNAGSALPPSVVTDTVVDYLRREEAIGGYETADERHGQLEAVYDSLGALVGAPREHMAVIENATRAWDMAVYGYPFERGDRVVTCRAEYSSNVLAFLQLERRFGIEMVLIDDDDYGQIDLAQVDTELAAGAAMMAMTHIPTSGGLINPAEEVGALCAKHGVFYVLDACQSAGQVPLDVNTIGCDVLSGTGRKYLRGPRGTGFLYAGERALEVLEPPFIDLHSADWTQADDYEWRPDARRFENWETYYAGKAGLGVAVDYALSLGIETTAARITNLGARLRAGLESLDRVGVHDKGARRGGIVTFTVDGVDAASVQAQLLLRKINTSTSGPDRARLDLEPRGLPTVIRASAHYYNSEDEIDAVIQAVDAVR
ncbi:MAG: aminotransferase class V-fold PLP-dependent enzyme [Acidimicrobiales bacterium]|nr:aminotransferase class V-fold PLP-dependent enzyme [Acidimicrobiales bacterium]MDG1876193.1 aminotransferase class V-fold PLP-dependent enzyme [Acidimicrobiales bacterium]